jgi:hypothetical protein
MTLRDYMAIHAPAAEIEDMTPHMKHEAAQALGLKPSDYYPETHYPTLRAKMRYKWAAAMLAEREKGSM